MPTFHTTSRLLNIYADNESWKRNYDEAQSCLNLEEQLAWGINIYRGLLDLEARAQTQALGKPNSEFEQTLALLTALYRLWTYASEFYLEKALEFSRKDYAVVGLKEFRATLEEARCLIDNLNLEEQIRPIEDLIVQARPANPRPERYRD